VDLDQRSEEESPYHAPKVHSGGPVKAGRILAVCGIAHSKTLAGLTERQRTELLNRVRYGAHTK
jgi:hypothetical protein